MIIGSDGLLYGTTRLGGLAGQGTIFRIGGDGNNYTVLKMFGGSDGAQPSIGLVEGPNTILYGTTIGGGSNNAGVIFRLMTDGSDYQVLKNFPGGNESSPNAPVVQDSDGWLYGTASGGTNFGCIFKIGLDGSGYTVLKTFMGGPSDGRSPMAGLCLGTNGVMYGNTSRGGSNDQGTVFGLHTDGTAYSVLKRFSAMADGWNPYGTLLLGPDGALFGTTVSGGTNAVGTLFTITGDGSAFTVLATFNRINGINPYAGLCLGGDGGLYGTALSDIPGRGGVVFRVNHDGTGFSTLLNLQYTGNDGGHLITLAHGNDGRLYGTTYLGGIEGFGTIFGIATNGSSYSVLKSFTQSDGVAAYGTILHASNGRLYGTITQGGAAGLGAIYSINPDGTDFAILKSFTGHPGEGYSPFAGLIQASDGLLYGTTEYGGAGGGIIFKLNLDGGGFTIIKTFNDQTGDPAYSFATLIEGFDGALYGTTAQGGSAFRGTVFKIHKDGTAYSLLRSFSPTNFDGNFPHGSLVQVENGTLLGTCGFGGKFNKGTVFKLNPDGSGYAVLKSFTGTNGDGAGPFAGLLRCGSGLLYGTTSTTVFQIRPDGTGYAVLKHFDSHESGGSDAGLVKGGDGTIYGGSFAGGDMRFGTVYSIIPPPVLMPLVFSAMGTEIPITGVPGRTYQLQKASSLTGLWGNIGSVTIDTTGNGTFLDLGDSAAENLFYRVAYP